MRRFLALLAAAFVLAATSAIAAQEPAYIVVDAETGAVLQENNSGQPWYPASVTKMMTAYLAFQALRTGQLTLTSPVKITANALAEPPSKMGYKVGTVLNVDNALKMMLVKSANDIAVAIAETVGGNEADFVAMMNREAGRLGMASTRFNNPNGLPDDGQVSTARDLAVLAQAIWREYPEYREYFRIPAIKAGKRILRSPNTLLEHFRGANGMKTGFICASGFNVVASADRNGRHLIAVVLGASSADQRTEIAAYLLNRGFATWATAMKPKLAEFNALPSGALPVNMREQICGKKEQQEDDGTLDPILAQFGAKSALVPRFVLMDPVPVFTGRADTPTSGVAGKQPLSNFPMPNLRPRVIDKTAAVGEEEQLLLLSPN